MAALDSAFVSGLLGALLGASASITGVIVTQRSAAGRDQQNYRRSIQDARRERLRDIYLGLSRASLQIQACRHEIDSLFTQRSTHAERLALAKKLHVVDAEIDDLIIRLRVESGTDKIVDIWAGSLGENLATLGDEKAVDREEWPEWMADSYHWAITGLGQMLQLSERHLASLEQLHGRGAQEESLLPDPTVDTAG
jgi:hypothetical protein